jgi:hypothetical protein
MPTSRAYRPARAFSAGSPLPDVPSRLARPNLYGRLPCGKRAVEALTRRVHCGLISGLWLQIGRLDPLRALMVIREAGAQLTGGLTREESPLSSAQLGRLTV